MWQGSNADTRARTWGASYAHAKHREVNSVFASTLTGEMCGGSGYMGTDIGRVVAADSNPASTRYTGHLYAKNGASTSASRVAHIPGQGPLRARGQPQPDGQGELSEKHEQGLQSCQ